MKSMICSEFGPSNFSLIAQAYLQIVYSSGGCYKPNFVPSVRINSQVKRGATNKPSLMKCEVYCNQITTKLKTPWSESASELYRPGDRRLSAK
jgi:hypothetical protein